MADRSCFARSVFAESRSVAILAPAQCSVASLRLKNRSGRDCCVDKFRRQFEFARKQVGEFADDNWGSSRHAWSCFVSPETRMRKCYEGMHSLPRAPSRLLKKPLAAERRP